MIYATIAIFAALGLGMSFAVRKPLRAGDPVLALDDAPSAAR
jgi:hypothetical protein